jgi:hypothetical protein
MLEIPQTCPPMGKSKLKNMLKRMVKSVVKDVAKKNPKKSAAKPANKSAAKASAKPAAKKAEAKPAAKAKVAAKSDVKLKKGSEKNSTSRISVVVEEKQTTKVLMKIGREAAEKVSAKSGKDSMISDEPIPRMSLEAASKLVDTSDLLTDEIVLTDAEGRRYCRATDCDQISTVDGYCRFHYLLYWKKIQVRKKILADGKLERYIDELTARYADKFIELLRKDLRSEKDFMAAIQELELDDSASSAAEEDETKSYIDEISGMTEAGVGSGSSRDDDY